MDMALEGQEKTEPGPLLERGGVSGAAPHDLRIAAGEVHHGCWFRSALAGIHHGVQLMMGVLTAGSATGQLIILPPVAAMAENIGWRPASLVIASAALIVVPLVWRFIRDYPEDRGVLPYGADQDTYRAPVRSAGGAVTRALDGLAYAARQRAFWALAIAFAICGATTNGLIGIHFIPSAHDHGISTTAAAGLLAAVGVFDIAGTIASGWLTDKFDPRKLLVAYYAFRGVSLLLLPWLLSEHVHPSMIVFVIIHGLD
jgi:predicted MFS family arabinose efflux permease